MPTIDTPKTENLLNVDDAAAVLDMSPRTLDAWRSSGRYRIPFIRVGRLVRYRRADLDAWLESRTVHPGEAA